MVTVAREPYPAYLALSSPEAGAAALRVDLCQRAADVPALVCLHA